MCRKSVGFCGVVVFAGLLRILLPSLRDAPAPRREAGGCLTPLRGASKYTGEGECTVVGCENVPSFVTLLSYS